MLDKKEIAKEVDDIPEPIMKVEITKQPEPKKQEEEEDIGHWEYKITKEDIEDEDYL